MTIDRGEALVDLAATVDYIGGITEAADQVDFETATDLRDALELVRKAAAEAASLLEGQMLKQLEDGSREYGKRVWVRTRRYVDRHDHDVLVARVEEAAIAAAVDKTTGEINARTAVQQATTRLRKLFLSPADKAKTTVAEKDLGLERDDYVSREYQGYKLSVTELDPG